MNAQHRKLLLILAVVAGSVLLQLQPATPISADSLEALGVGRPRNTSLKLENLHRRIVEQAKADEDEIDIKSAGHHLALSPERAAQLAVRSRGGGQVTYIELQYRNSKPTYHVKIGQSVHHIDATTGEVTWEDSQ